MEFVARLLLYCVDRKKLFLALGCRSFGPECGLVFFLGGGKGNFFYCHRSTWMINGMGSTKGWPIFGLLARLSEVILLSGQVPNLNNETDRGG